MKVLNLPTKEMREGVFMSECNDTIDHHQKHSHEKKIRNPIAHAISFPFRIHISIVDKNKEM
jgi:hypothetical protein